MKKSLLALAALTAFAGAASAQSSVTLYGRVELAAGKNIGSDAKVLQNGSGSRFGVRGVEDLGGGMSADFNLEHRFDADTGNQSATRFWHGRSTVGLKGGFGRIALGREYTPAFLYAQYPVDPFEWDSSSFGFAQTAGGIGTVRNDNSINYQIGGGGFNFWGQIAEGDGMQKRPIGFAVNYSAGPMYLAYGYENPGDADDVWHYLNANYNFGVIKLLAGFGTGTNTVGGKHRQIQLGATAPVGAGEFRVAFGQLKNTTLGVTAEQKMVVGYHYFLSKRTKVYVDFANDSKAATSKSGYRVGMRHNF